METAPTVNEAKNWAEGVFDYCMKLLTEYGFRVLGAIVVLIVAYIVAGWTKRAVLAALDRAKFDATISKFVSNVARYAVIVLGLMSCAPIMGINITAFAAILGSIGLAVGLASQGALSNGAAGLMLLIMRPFKAGDLIVVDGISGTVEEIELFATTLNTPDNRRIFIPNNSIFGKIIENSTLNPHRSTTFFTVVAPECDVEKVRSTPATGVRVVSLGLEGARPHGAARGHGGRRAQMVGHGLGRNRHARPDTGRGDHGGPRRSGAGRDSGADAGDDDPTARSRRMTAPRPTGKLAGTSLLSMEARMANVNPVPEGYGTITPGLVVRNGAKAIDFYKKAFGAEERMRMPGPDGKSIMHAELKIGSSIFMLNDENREWGALSPESLNGTPCGFYLYVNDADAWQKRAHRRRAPRKSCRSRTCSGATRWAASWIRSATSGTSRPTSAI